MNGRADELAVFAYSFGVSTLGAYVEGRPEKLHELEQQGQAVALGTFLGAVIGTALRDLPTRPPREQTRGPFATHQANLRECGRQESLRAVARTLDRDLDLGLKSCDPSDPAVRVMRGAQALASVAARMPITRMPVTSRPR